MTSTDSSSRTHGELKRDIAVAIGSDPDRYGGGTGTERHKCLTKPEYVGIAEALGLRLPDETKQQLRDSIMLKLGRDHRTGVGYLDTSDLSAIHAEVCDVE